MKKFSPKIYSYSLIAMYIAILTWSVSCKKDPNIPVTVASLNQISTVVSYSAVGYKDGPLNQALFKGISGIAIDTQDNLYIADYSNNRIRKITHNGIVSTFAGSGSEGLKDGPALEAMFAGPNGLIVDELGNLYVGHFGAIRKITPSGIVSTIVGVEPSKAGYLQYDTLGLTNPSGLAFDENKNLYVTSHDGNLSRVVKVAPNGRYSVFVGIPFPGKTRPVNDQVSVYITDGVAYDFARGIFYVTDASYGIIKVTSDGSSTCYSNCKYAGHEDGPMSTAKFWELTCAVLDKAGNLYVGDRYYIRKITPDGIVSTVAGSGDPGSQDGPGDKASFRGPSYLAFDSKGNLFVADAGGIRKITFPK